MSLCVVTGRQCVCQPEEDFPCPGVEALRRELADARRKALEEAAGIAAEKLKGVPYARVEVPAAIRAALPEPHASKDIINTDDDNAARLERL